MRNDPMKIFVNDEVKEIKARTGSELYKYMQELIEDIAELNNIEIEKNNVLDLSDDNLKLEVLEAIYENIKDKEDKDLFGDLIVNNVDLLGEEISNEFKNKLEDEEELIDDYEDYEEISIEDEEELEEKQEKEESNDAEEKSDTKDEKTETAIETYERETKKLELKLEELEKEYERKLKELQEQTNIIPSDISKLQEEYEKLVSKISELENNPEDNMYPGWEKDLEEHKKRVEEIKAQIKEYNENLPENKEAKLKEEYDKLISKISELENNPEDNMYPGWEKDLEEYKKRVEEINEELKEYNENLPENKEAKLKEEYDKLISKISELENNPEDNMYPGWEKDLEEYKKRVEEINEELKEYNENLPENKETKLKEEYDKLISKISEIENNPEDNMYPGWEKDLEEYKKRAEEIKEELDNLSIPHNRTRPADIDKQNEELQNLENIKKAIEKSKEELKNRKNNIDVYYDALKDIKDIEQQIKSGKKPEDEEIINKVDAVKSKIKNLPKDLKEELEQYLKNALGKKRKKVTSVNKDIKSWFDKHPVIKLISLGLAITITSQVALGAVMMINSALYNAIAGGLAIKDAPGIAQFLHGINNALSNIVGFGQFKFVGETGLYTLGGNAGAHALYNVSTNILKGIVDGTVALGAGYGTYKSVKGLLSSLKEKWENRKNEKKEQEELEKEVPEKEELEEVEEKEKNKPQTVDKENDEMITISKSKLAELIKEQVEEQTKGLIEQNRLLKEKFEEYTNEQNFNSPKL